MATRTVTVDLGGQTRRLKLTLWSVERVGETLGINVKLNSLQEDLLAVPLPLKTLSLLLWAALVHEDDSLTPDQVAKWVDQDNAAEVLNAFLELFGGRLSATAKQTIAESMGVPGTEILTPT